MFSPRTNPIAKLLNAIPTIGSIGAEPTNQLTDTVSVTTNIAKIIKNHMMFPFVLSEVNFTSV